MKVLHINSNYIYSRLYENLLDNVDKSIDHVIYCPRKEDKTETESKYRVIQPKIVRRTDSLFTRIRLQRTYKYINNKINLETYQILHAHTLTNDGLLAYKIYKKYKKSYIVTIRNTDVNFTLKYKRFNIKLYEKVLNNATLIILPNQVYKDKLKLIFRRNQETFDKINNALVIPNGIDDFWIEHTSSKVKNLINTKKVRLLFVGRIYKYKNIHNVINALKVLETESVYQFEFNIVGKIIDQKYFEHIMKENKINYLGYHNKIEIKKIMDESEIFVMPSLGETFGLVYIESLSQNLPIILSENEGIDKFFEDGKFGKSVDPNNPSDIAAGILNVINNYDVIQNNLKDKNFLTEFVWKEIGVKYSSIYRELNQI